MALHLYIRTLNERGNPAQRGACSLRPDLRVALYPLIFYLYSLSCVLKHRRKIPPSPKRADDRLADCRRYYPDWHSRLSHPWRVELDWFRIHDDHYPSDSRLHRNWANGTCWSCIYHQSYFDGSRKSGVHCQPLYRSLLPRLLSGRHSYPTATTID